MNETNSGSKGFSFERWIVSVKGNRLPRITGGAINISRCINEKGENGKPCVCMCVCVCSGRICMVPGSRLDTSQDRRQTVSARGIISRARGNFTDREQTRFSPPPPPSSILSRTRIWSRAKPIVDTLLS